MPRTVTEADVDRILSSKLSSAAELRDLLKLYMSLQPSSPAWFRATDLIVGVMLAREIKRAEVEEAAQAKPDVVQ